MNRNNGTKFAAVVLIFGVLTYLLFAGLKIGDFELKNIYNTRQGIDIKGGVYAVLYPDKENPSEDDLNAARTIIERRLDAKNIFDRNVSVEKATKRIVMEIPWKSGEKDYNPQNTINELGKTAMLTFREVGTNDVDEKGNIKPTGAVVLEGADVSKAYVQSEDGQPVVALELDDAGAKKFDEATGRLINQRIAIFMDDQMIVAPTVQAHITDGKAVINGQRSAAEARELAETIQGGSLPFKLVTKQVNSISPLLGENALNATVKAGILAFILIFLFMIAFYRLPGLFANIALAGLVVAMLAFISWSQVSLTLPGIAGIILSMGMGVDANVIIFERIKEELRFGKSLNAAIDLGFKRAFSAILDSNVTTMITAAVLYKLGSGPIRGFAVTLFVGVLISFVTAVTASKIMIKFTSGFGIAKHKWLYGVNGGGNKNA